jgi:hypothetical protein
MTLERIDPRDYRLLAICDSQAIMIAKPYRKLNLLLLLASHANLCAQIDPTTA